jgi:hypothetical protein
MFVPQLTKVSQQGDDRVAEIPNSLRLGTLVRLGSVRTAQA